MMQVNYRLARIGQFVTAIMQGNSIKPAKDFEDLIHLAAAALLAVRECVPVDERDIAIARHAAAAAEAMTQLVLQWEANNSVRTIGRLQIDMDVDGKVAITVLEPNDPRIQPGPPQPDDQT